MNSDPVYVAVIGTGGVGSVFLSQLHAVQGTYPNVKVVAITRSNKSIYVSSFNRALALETWSTDLENSTQSGLTPRALLTFLQAGIPARTAVIDNTSSQAVADFYPYFLAVGISVVTPNKKAFSGNLSLWTEILQFAFQPTANSTGGYLYHESSVGAGLPIISTLQDLVDTGDKVKRIEGIMSGSLSFLFNNFMPLPSSSSSGPEAALPWSAHVKKAQELGYTEPDPRDDLSGLDVARKLVILARVAGLLVEKGTESFPVQSLIPKALESCASGDEFLARLPEFDAEVEKMREQAQEKGQVVRYVGSVDVEKGELRVGMAWLDARSPLAGLRGSDNVFSFVTERYGGRPLVVQGAGAGGEVTAMGVTADLIKVVQRLG